MKKKFKTSNVCKGRNDSTGATPDLGTSWEYFPEWEAGCCLVNYVTKTYLHSALLENTSLAFAFCYVKIDKQPGCKVQHTLCLGMSHDVIFICLAGGYRPS